MEKANAPYLKAEVTIDNIVRPATAYETGDDNGASGGVTPSVSGFEGTGYEVQISVTSETAAPGGGGSGGGDGGDSES